MSDDTPYVDFISVASTSGLIPTVAVPLPISSPGLDSVVAALAELRFDTPESSLSRNMIEVVLGGRSWGDDARLIVESTAAASVSGVVPSLGAPIPFSSWHWEAFYATMDGEDPIIRDNTGAILVRNSTAASGVAGLVGTQFSAPSVARSASLGTSSFGGGGGGGGGWGRGGQPFGGLTNTGGLPPAQGEPGGDDGSSDQPPTDQPPDSDPPPESNGGPAPEDDQVVPSAPWVEPPLDTEPVDDDVPGSAVPEIDLPPADDSTLFDPGDDFTDPLFSLPPVDLQDPLESFPPSFPEVFDPPSPDENIATVPEPGSLVAWSLLGLAGCGYAWRIKRRRRRCDAA